MRFENRSVVCLAFLLVGLLCVGVTYAQDDEPAPATVTLLGYVEAAEYDDEDNVVAISIYDSEWGAVLIRRSGKGGELMKHLDAEVELTGTLVELDDDSGFSYAISVTSFKLVNPAEPDDDPGF